MKKVIAGVILCVLIIARLRMNPPHKDASKVVTQETSSALEVPREGKSARTTARVVSVSEPANGPTPDLPILKRVRPGPKLERILAMIDSKNPAAKNLSAYLMLAYQEVDQKLEIKEIENAKLALLKELSTDPEHSRVLTAETLNALDASGDRSGDNMIQRSILFGVMGKLPPTDSPASREIVLREVKSLNNEHADIASVLHLAAAQAFMSSVGPDASATYEEMKPVLSEMDPDQKETYRTLFKHRYPDFKGKF